MGLANDSGMKETIMIHLDSELARDFLDECRDRLISAEADLLSMEQDGREGDENRSIGHSRMCIGSTPERPFLIF